jgi:type IV pilus assembly protein PilP
MMKHLPKARGRQAAALMLTTLALAGCGADIDELKAWMDTQRREVKPNVTPLVAPKRFDPQAYMAANAVSPFSSHKLAVATRQDMREPNPLLTAELNRRREPLEAFPLDSMSMVGSMNKQGRAYALLKVDALLYQIKVGDHLGQNYGRVTRVAENEVGLREIVQDASGEWIERQTALQLQDKAGVK